MYRTFNVKVHGNMLKEAGKVCIADDKYRKFGLGMTGFIRYCVQAEIDRQSERNKLREMFLSAA